MNETLIEKYVGFPESLDPQTLAAVEEYIRTDPVGREIAAFYQAFYLALRKGDSIQDDSSQRAGTSNGTDTSASKDSQFRSADPHGSSDDFNEA